MNAGRTLVGIALIGAGVVFLLEAVGAIEGAGALDAWWPLLVVGLGILQAVSARRIGGPAAALIVLGLLLLAVTTGVFGERAGRVAWPLVAVVAGGWLVSGWGRSRRRRSDAAHLDVLSVLDSARMASDSRALRRADLTAVCGKLVLDLTGAALAPGGARISITSILGHVDVLVPEGWRVEVRGLPLIGGWDDTTSKRRLGPQSPVLEVRILAVLGGAELKHNPRWA
jgi:hypothetical protein